MRHPKGYSPQAVGVIEAAALVERYVIPHRDSRKKQGYQRPTSKARVNKLIADLRRGQVDIPTAVLLNQRDFDRPAHLVEGNEGDAVLTPNGSDLFVVDGQHRIEALARLVEENPESWGSYELTFVCMLGADEHEEMKQSYVVNSTAKSVRTDLALDLLKQQAENDPLFMDALIQKGEDWKVDAQTITDALDKTRIWKGRIRLPRDDDRLRRHGRVSEAGARHAVLRGDLNGEPSEDPGGLLGGHRQRDPRGLRPERRRRSRVRRSRRVRDPEVHERNDHAPAPHSDPGATPVRGQVSRGAGELRRGALRSAAEPGGRHGQGRRCPRRRLLAVWGRRRCRLVQQ